jgi:hypothetical protein
LEVFPFMRSFTYVGCGYVRSLLPHSQSKDNFTDHLWCLFVCLFVCELCDCLIVLGFSQQPSVIESSGFLEAFLAMYREHTLILLITLFIIVNACWVVPLFLLQTYNISQNLTTNERANWQRYSHLLDERGRFYNPYNKGILRNFKEILCEDNIQESIDKTI